MMEQAAVSTLFYPTHASLLSSHLHHLHHLHHIHVPGAVHGPQAACRQGGLPAAPAGPGTCGGHCWAGEGLWGVALGAVI